MRVLKEVMVTVAKTSGPRIYRPGFNPPLKGRISIVVGTEWSRLKHYRRIAAELRSAKVNLAAVWLVRAHIAAQDKLCSDCVVSVPNIFGDDKTWWA